jgi:hypothetical protein
MLNGREGYIGDVVSVLDIKSLQLKLNVSSLDE